MVRLGAGSAPHGVIVGPDRAPWITATPGGQVFYASEAGSHIGRSDHRTGAESGGDKLVVVRTG